MRGGEAGIRRRACLSSVVLLGQMELAMKITFFRSASVFRDWLASNHHKVQELCVGFYKKKSGKDGISYPEAVDQALCFGWIDGIKKKADEVSYTHRFSPRKSKTNWSSNNIKRVGELSKLGLMHPSGIKVFN